MPTYEYECTKCAHRFEIVQRFADAALTSCQLCEGDLRKVYAPVGVVFKGSGFYKNDSRGSAPSSSTTKESNDTKESKDTKDVPATKSDVAVPASSTPSAAPATASSSSATSSSE